ncbi:MAG TPA: hypothetical protein VEA16_14015 [Vicinamibacterales bacterium]|nr:hypothetical protein [Vicinamibacterales bacterium]
MAMIDYLDGGDNYDWRDWIQEERNLDQPNYEPPRVETVPDDFTPLNDSGRPLYAEVEPIPTQSANQVHRPDDPSPPMPSAPPPPPPPPPPAPNPTPWSPPANDPHQEHPGVNDMIARDRASWEARLRASAARHGVGYDPSDLEGIIRQVSYGRNVGRNPDDFLRDAEGYYQVRGESGGDKRRGGYDTSIADSAVAQTGGSGSLEYWQARGIGANQMFDANGQMKPGWARVGNGYAYTGTRTPPPTAPPTAAPPPPQPPRPAPPTPGGLGSQAVAGGNLPNYQRPDVNVPNQFSDALTKWIEQFAQMRAQELENPRPNSGQALLEQILREVSGDFRGGGYTPHEMEIFQTQALDPLERLRATRKQQVLQTLANRGISPNSGIGISMLADVDRQFDAQRSEVQRSIAGEGARERTARIQQAVQLLSGLANTENQRLNESFQYRSVPLNLADRSFNQASQVFGMNETSANNAFNRAFQLFNASGNPMSLVNPLIQLQQNQQGRNDNWQEALGYLAYILANGGGQRAA